MCVTLHHLSARTKTGSLFLAEKGFNSFTGKKKAVIVIPSRSCKHQWHTVLLPPPPRSFLLSKEGVNSGSAFSGDRNVSAWLRFRCPK